MCLEEIRVIFVFAFLGQATLSNQTNADSLSSLNFNSKHSEYPQYSPIKYVDHHQQSYASGQNTLLDSRENGLRQGTNELRQNYESPNKISNNFYLNTGRQYGTFKQSNVPQMVLRQDNPKQEEINSPTNGHHTVLYKLHDQHVQKQPASQQQNSQHNSKSFYAQQRNGQIAYHGSSSLSQKAPSYRRAGKENHLEVQLGSSSAADVQQKHLQHQQTPRQFVKEFSHDTKGSNVLGQQSSNHFQEVNGQYKLDHIKYDRSWRIDTSHTLPPWSSPVLKNSLVSQQNLILPNNNIPDTNSFQNHAVVNYYGPMQTHGSRSLPHEQKPLLQIDKRLIQQRDSSRQADKSIKTDNVHKNLHKLQVVRHSEENNAAAPNKTGSTYPQLEDYSNWLTVVPLGQIGNQMFQYATLLGMANVTNRKPFVQPHMIVGSTFKISAPTYSIPKQKRHQLLIKVPFERSLFQLNDTINVIWGFFNSWFYFNHIGDQIHQEFTFKELYIYTAHRFLADVSRGREAVTYVGVHVRRGDYQQWVKENHAYEADARYLSKAMSYYRSRYNDAVFVVCSDDISWCKRNIPNTKHDVVYSDRNFLPEEDLAVLAHCNHSVMTMGSFGWWASYLAPGEKVYFTDYFKPEARQLKLGFEFVYKFPPHWIGFGPQDLD